jgi:hypothetical protein
MGTSGSFDIATITDLFLLEMVFIEDYGMNSRKIDGLFNKVGDDLWVYDPKDIVRKTYTEMCGVSINLSKSKSASKRNLCGEFVSRNINFGKDVSRISANICRAVGKNILDLPQLAIHLEERGCVFTIPLNEIFVNNKIKNNHRMHLIRSFYILCKLQPDQRFRILEKSLSDEFPGYIKSDPVISTLDLYGVGIIKDTYYSYVIKKLLNSILSKNNKMFDARHEFMPSTDIAI